MMKLVYTLIQIATRKMINISLSLWSWTDKRLKSKGKKLQNDRK